jgi:hypothetical protein
MTRFVGLDVSQKLTVIVSSMTPGAAYGAVNARRIPSRSSGPSGGMRGWSSDRGRDGPPDALAGPRTAQAKTRHGLP